MTFKIEGLRTPSLLAQLGECLGKDITPDEICEDERALGELYEKHPLLAGDSTAIGPGDDGGCQSWRENRRWWRKELNEHQ